MFVSWVLCDWEMVHQTLSKCFGWLIPLCEKAGGLHKTKFHFPWRVEYVRLVKDIIELVGQPVDQNRRNVFLLYFDNLLVYFILCCNDTV